MKPFNHICSTLAAVILIALAPGAPAFADPLNIPYTFTAGTAAKASEVNANFDAVETSVNNISTAQLKDGSVTTAKIVDGTIGTADLANGAITGTKIAAGTIGDANIALASIASTKLLNGVGVRATSNSSYVPVSTTVVTICQIDFTAGQLPSAGKILVFFSGTAQVDGPCTKIDIGVSSGAPAVPYPYNVEAGFETPPGTFGNVTMFPFHQISLIDYSGTGTLSLYGCAQTRVGYATNGAGVGGVTMIALFIPTTY